MYLKNLLSLTALAGAVSAQMSLNATIANNTNLSTLAGLLSATGLLTTLNGLQNITVLAPSNEAIAAFLNSSSPAAANDSNLVSAILQYHVLNGTYSASQITNMSSFVPTLLMNQTYTKVTGGQVVEAVTVGGNVTFFSGLGANSSVVTPNVNFTGGVAHVIDRVLTLPQDVVTTGIAANLTALVGALNATNLTSTVAGLQNITVFAPNNAAFESIGSAFANASAATLASVLQYHVVAGTIGYSTALMNNMTLNSVNGAPLRITLGENGTVFVNSAEVVRPNVLISNGVLHVIDNVLNPMNSTATPTANATSGAPAFTGSSVTLIPFTSNVASTAASTTVGGGAAAATSSSKAGAAAVPMKTGAMGAAALFGAGAALIAY